MDLGNGRARARSAPEWLLARDCAALLGRGNSWFLKRHAPVSEPPTSKSKSFSRARSRSFVRDFLSLLSLLSLVAFVAFVAWSGNWFVAWSARLDLGICFVASTLCPGSKTSKYLFHVCPGFVFFVALSGI